MNLNIKQLASWIEESKKDIDPQRGIEELRDVNSVLAAYMTSYAIKALDGDKGLVSVCATIGADILGTMARKRDAAKEAKIGHHILYYALKANGMVDFTNDTFSSNRFLEGKWRMYSTKKGDLHIDAGSKKQNPYMLEITNEEWIGELVDGLSVDDEYIPEYGSVQFTEPEGFFEGDNGFVHAKAGEMVRKANRRIRRIFERTPDHKAVSIINKAMKVPYIINEDLLAVYKKIQKRDELFTLKSSTLKPKPKKSIKRAMNNELKDASEIGSRKFWTFKFYDYRSRLYSSSRYTRHDGSKLNKSLIMLSNKKALGTEGLFWLKMNVANCAGFDKVSIEERVDIVDAALPYIIEVAKNPVANRQWTGVDDPFSFLAAVMELEKAYRLDDPAEFESGLMVGIDASCSGLQILSAISKDEVSAKLCNLTGGARGDYYKHIADKVWGSMGVSEGDEAIYNEVIESIKGINDYYKMSEILRELGSKIYIANAVFWNRVIEKRRAISKRPCMTYFYSCKPETMANSLYKDFFGKKGFEGITPAFCFILAKKLYDTCRTEMKGATQLMDLFIKLAHRDYKNGKQYSLLSPYTLFPFIQNYEVAEKPVMWFRRGEGSKKNNSENNSHFRMRVYVGTNGTINHHKVKSASSPNSVHMLDSQLVAAVIHSADYDVSCVHDCFYTTPADVGKLYEDTREQFVGIFNRDMLGDILRQKQAEDLRPTITEGSLDVNDVYDNEFFVS